MIDIKLMDSFWVPVLKLEPLISSLSLYQDSVKSLPCQGEKKGLFEPVAVNPEGQIYSQNGCSDPLGPV